MVTLSANGEMTFTGTDPNQVVDIDLQGSGAGNKVTFDKAGYGNDVTVKGYFSGVEEVNFNGLGTAIFTNDGLHTRATNLNNLDGLTNVNVNIADDLATANGRTGGFSPTFSAVTLATGVDFTFDRYDNITFTIEGAMVGTARDYITLTGAVSNGALSFTGATSQCNGRATNFRTLSAGYEATDDATNNVMHYLFDYTSTDSATGGTVTRTYRLGYDKNKLTFAAVADNEGYFVNSAYASIPGNDQLDGQSTTVVYGGLRGLTEFSSLRLEGMAFGTYGTEQYKQYNCPFDQFPTTAYTSNIFLTGGTYSQNQYGYGSNLQVCNDQRHAQTYVGSAGKTNANASFLTDPVRFTDPTHVKGNVQGTAANTQLDSNQNGSVLISGGVLFGGSNVQVYNGTAGLKAYLANKNSSGDTIYTECATSHLSSHVDILATISASGIVSGSNINVKASGATVISTGCNLYVGEARAKYLASSVATKGVFVGGQLIGGNYICGGSTNTNVPFAVTVNGGSKVTIDEKGGIMTKGFVVGGSKVGSVRKNNVGHFEADGKALDVTLNGAGTFSIASGTFDGDVAAGSLLEGQDSKLKTTNDTVLTITGGTFKKNIYGGNLGYKLGANDLVASDDLWHTADTKLEFIVPGTANALNIKGHILGGSADKGRVDGDARIIFSGDNTHGGLTFGTSSMISGDSMHAGWWGGTHTSYVAKATNKKRYLEFGKGTDGTEFIGNFGISGIVNIDELSFKGKSRVTFTNTTLDFHDIDTWNFNYWGDKSQSQMTYGGDIEFKEDVLNVTGLDTLAVVGDSWKMVSNNTDWIGSNGNKQFSAVTLNGISATWHEGTDNYWYAAESETSGFKLTLTEGTNGGILVTRIA